MSSNTPQPDRQQRLAEAVVQHGWLTPAQFGECAAAVEELHRSGVDIDLEHLLLARGLLTPEQVVQATADAEQPRPGTIPAEPARPTAPPAAPPEDEPGHTRLEHFVELPAGTSEPPAGGGADSGINLNLVQSAADLNTCGFFRAPAAPPPATGTEGTAAPGQPMLGEVRFVRTGPEGAPPDIPGGELGVRTNLFGAPGAAPPPAARESFLKSIRQGASLGPYRIVEPIGAGSFGSVYLAEDSQSMLGTRVALKVPRYQSLSHDELDRYRHEAKLWRALSQDRHPNVLELFNLNRFDGVIAFVMEYVDGANLADFAANAWRQGPFPLGEATRIVRAVAEALKVIHAKRVYHGDLKPANILVRKDDGAVKVTDFSISRSVTAGGAVPERYFAGTPAYMAPEVWQGRATLQSDLFALGAIFYELVTGARPFQANNTPELMALILRGELRGPASALRPDLPFHIERIILRCLEVAVEDRYASVTEMLEDLHLVDTSQDLVTRLAECVIEHSAPDDLTFLIERDLPGKGYRGDDHRSLVIEYCLDEDPQQILLSCFSKAGLARLAERLGASVGEGYADREQYARAILGRLGLAGSGNPRGIHDSVRFATNLRHRLEQVRDAADVAGLVTPAVREYEKVLRDLLRFYGQFLYGRFHERSLARLARKRLAEHKRDLGRATLGELLGVVQALNEHLAADSAEAQHFERVFRRRHAVPPALLAQSRVVALRNAFMHGHETLAGAGLSKVRDAARELLNEIVEFLRAIEQEGVYPRIVAVESFVTDHFGRRYVFCRNDQGQLEKVFTNVAVDPSRHYFFYPTTNPMRIYPILVPT